MTQAEPERKRVLLEADVSPDPTEQFARWFEELQISPPTDPVSVGLATATPEGIPSVRMVLLKGFDKRGFVFFTNYGSRKALEMEATGRAALVFYFKEQNRQVRIEGLVERVSTQESDAYFATRERGSQISAIVSRQGTVLESRDQLEAQVRAIEAEYADRAIPRPEYWGGYRLTPSAFEFWQGRLNRLHDRLRYTLLADGDWVIERLAP